MPIPATPDLPVDANGIDCLDCMEVHLDRTEADGCPEDDSHATQSAFITKTPLGLEHDQDYYHHGREQYEYTGEDVVRPNTA